MSTPNEKLGRSLGQLVALQARGLHVVPSKALSRTHRQRLVKAGFLREAFKGWYVPSRPDQEPGDTAAWYAGMREFVAGYCNERFGANWHVGPEQSLLLLTGERTLPRQIYIWAIAGNNQTLQLPHGCSLFLYRTPRLLSARSVEDAGGMRLVELAHALVAVGPTFFTQQPLAARIALGSLADASDLLRALLTGSHSVVAGRLAGALRSIGRPRLADELIAGMRAADYVVVETQPFEQPPSALPGARPESPYVQRLRLMWSDMRETVIGTMPAPSAGRVDIEGVLSDVEARSASDAYHSLSIEGYRVTSDLIERVRAGNWNPEGQDAQQRDAMAAKGYFEAHRLVKDFVARVLGGAQPGVELRANLQAWYRALFGASVQAGILKSGDLAGWRNSQVFIRGALHIPLSRDAVRECMPVFFELVEQEPHAAVRAVLGHFFFVYIHPYVDGNGRLGRFVMNAMLASGGYVWTIIPVQRRKDYMAALEQASSFRNIEPFASLIGELVREQACLPLPHTEAGGTEVKEQT